MVRIDHWVSADERGRGKMDATLMSVAAIPNLLPIFKSLSGDPPEDFIANQQP